LAPTGAGWFGAGTGVGVGVGVGPGLGEGLGVGAGAVPGLLDLDGKPPVTGVGVVGDDGSVDPQLLAASAKATITKNGARMVSLLASWFPASASRRYARRAPGAWFGR